MRLNDVLTHIDNEILTQIGDKFNSASGINPRNLSWSRDQLSYSLAMHLNMPGRVYLALDSLTDVENKFVEYLAANGGELLREDVIHETFDNDESRYTSILQRLQSKNLVFEANWFTSEKFQGTPPRVVVIPQEFLFYIEPHLEQQHLLGKALNHANAETLQRILKTELKISSALNFKPCVMHELRKHLLNPEFLKRYIASFSKTHKQMLEFMLQRNGVAREHELLQHFNIKRTWLFPKNDDQLVLFLQKGIAYSPSETMYSGYNAEYYIPTDVLEIIQNGYQPPEKKKPVSHEVAITRDVTPPAITKDNGANILKDIAAFLGYVSVKGLRILKKGGVAKQDVKKILPLFAAEKIDETYAVFIASFCSDANLIVANNDRWTIGREAEKWFGNPAQCLLSLLDFWECSYYNGDEGWFYAQREKQLADYHKRSRLTEQVLAEFSTGSWFSFNQFMTLLRQRTKDYEREWRKTHRKELERQYYREYVPQESHIRLMLAQGYYYLGIIALGNPGAYQVNTTQKFGYESVFQTNDGMLTMTEFGRVLLQKDRTALAATLQTQEKMEKFILQPNYEIVLPPNYDHYLYFRLLRFTDMKSLDVTTTLVINKESLRRALDAGMSIETIKTFLNEHSKTALPQTVESLLDECARKYGEISLGDATAYLMTKDATLMKELLVQKEIKQHVKKVLSGTIAILSSDVNAEKIATALRKRGYMPKVDEDNEP
jgi:hypothetical protein